MSSVFRSETGRRLVHERYRSLLETCPVPAEQLHLPTLQGETFVLTCGPRDAAPLVLFHGGATTSAMWLRNLPAWSQRFRVYAVDIIGEPGFSAPSRPPMSSDAYARWLDDVWSALALDRASIVGASLGGWLGIDFAIRRPARVGRLALLAPAGVGAINPAYWVKAVPYLLLGAWGRRKSIEAAMGLDPAELTDEGKAFLDFFDLAVANMVFRRELPPRFSDPMLRGLKPPLLAAVGGRDIVFRSDETRRRFETCVPGSRVLFLPDAGHGLTDLTTPVLEFLLET